jgi:transposase
MRFVPVKDESQQAMQCLHRTRQGFIEEKQQRIIAYED